jgi:hypothetical protein
MIGKSAGTGVRASVPLLDSRRMRYTRRPLCSALVAVLAALVVAACGGSSGNPQQARTVLREAFTGAQPINSGKLAVRLAVTPTGSKTLAGPLGLDFGGPFQSLGPGKVPKSDFTIDLNALGHSGSMGVISTGTKGYVSLQGSNYQLPQSEFRQLGASLAQVTSSGGGSQHGLLARLGINPLEWVRNPTIAGSANLGGAQTTHVHAGVDLRRFLQDIDRVVHRAPSLGSTRLGSGISRQALGRIVREVRKPTLDVWAGKSDHLLRKLEINFGLPVSGSVSTLLGGLRAAHVLLMISYSDLNQPQTITAPASTQPFSRFTAKVQGLLQGLGSLSGGIPQTGGSTPSSGNLQLYSQCIQKAGSDVAKMQRCAAILNK